MKEPMNERHKEIASSLPADLDALPRLDGFRLRGLQMTRLSHRAGDWFLNLRAWQLLHSTCTRSI
ncbi:hypothetical protein BH20VER3_BH20VER3_04580 [soil metagenome]